MTEITGDSNVYVGYGIMCLYGSNTAFVGGVIATFGIEGFKDGEQFLKSMKQKEKEKAFENLLCCGILNINDNGELTFDKDRYMKMNSLGMKVDKEKYKNYIGMGSLEDIVKYDNMTKFVKKWLKK